METANGFSASKVWVLFALSTTGMLIFAVLYFLTPHGGPTQLPAQIVTKTVTNTLVSFVTNEVIKEVPKEIEKIVNVPAEIPSEYSIAMDIFQQMTNATVVASDGVLFKMHDVRTVCSISDALRGTISEDQLKARFELTLRRNNIPLNPISSNVLVFDISCTIGNRNGDLVVYDTDCHVDEPQVIWREGECHRAAVRVWSAEGRFGANSDKTAIQEIFLKNAERSAELFANDYLAANPKPQ